MTKPLALGRLLLASTMLIAPSAMAQTAPTNPSTQTTPPPSPPSTPATPDTAAADNPQQKVDVSIPGADPDIEEIVVRGRFIPEVIRATPQIVSVLSTEDIARTGEGDIAGALQRVTGLSVVGPGFVYVRGLGDRYSLALLNGSPLPSPEPLRRVVPLDIFPTTTVASALVQKSYSANFPAEFGGGLINLTTIAVPDEPFLSIGGSISGDTFTSTELGYTYDGGDWDRFGYDDGTRDIPDGLRAAIDSGLPIVEGSNFSGRQLQDFAASLVNAETTVLQTNRNIPFNLAGDVTAGTSFDVGEARVGVIATIGADNGWRTRDARQQSSLDPELVGAPQTDFRTVITDNRATVNGLLGFGAEFGEHSVRWTNVYIHDTVKQGRLASGSNRNVADQAPGEPDTIIEQNTYWFERQLIDTQFVGEFELGDFGLDLRGAYANTQRESPYERGFSYFYSNQASDYVNNLSSGGQSADITFSDLDEDLWAGSVDLSYDLPTANNIVLSAGYAYTNTERELTRRQFQYFRPEGALPLPIAQQRPDFLVSDFNIYTYNIQLRDISTAEGAAAYEADLEIHAGYAQASVELFDGFETTLGVRYEDAEQSVLPSGTQTRTSLDNDYFFPAATATWNFADNLQLRLHGSKTLARPQFRELAAQLFQDFESDRQFTGNPLLTDSDLYNGEARLEWYLGRGERLTVAGFYKHIEDPIEPVAFIAGGGGLRTGFANAPEAELYGAEVEALKYFPLDTFIGGDLFATLRLVLIGNYTYTQSELKVDDELVFGPQQQALPADTLFRDGAPLTGQSDHLFNVQIGFEDTERLSQQTLLLTYASDRVTTRGPISGILRQPDLVAEPGFRLDFVARQGFPVLGRNVELSFEARNITGRRFEEFQEFGENRIENNTFDVGTSISLGLGVAF